MLPTLRCLTLLALLLGATLQVAAAESASEPLDDVLRMERLVNADFTLPSPYPRFERDVAFVRVAVESERGTYPPETERDHAQDGALGWTHRVLSGQREPLGSVDWLQGGVLRVHVDAADEGPHTAVITQPTGHRGRAAMWEVPWAVDVHVTLVEGAPVKLHALAATAPGNELKVSESVVLEPSPLPRVVRLHFEGPIQTGMSQFYLALGTQSAGGARIHLDEVELRGAPPLPKRS